MLIFSDYLCILENSCSFVMKKEKDNMKMCFFT